MKNMCRMFNLLLSVLATTAFLSCNHSSTEGEAEAMPVEANSLVLNEVQYKNAGIEMGKIQKRHIASVLKVNGIIDVPPQNMVSIGVPLGGYLTSMELLPGMHVKKGDIIAVMEDPQYIQIQQDYLTAKARLTFAEKEFLRQKELNESKSISDKSFQLAQSDYTSQKVLVKALAEKLLLIGIEPGDLNEENLSRNIEVRSPIDGFVSKVFMNIGKYAKAEDVLFEIVNPEDIHLNLNIFEKDINKVFIGQQVQAYTNNDPEKKYKCEVILIGKDFGTDRSIEVHCHFENYDANLIPGMFMNAELECESRETLVLPAEAVLSYDDKNYVFRSEDEKVFEMMEVKVGISEGKYTEVVPGPDSSLLRNRIVTHGAYWLLMQLKNKSE